MIENSMIRHIQDAIVVLNKCCRIKDRFSEEAWESWRCREFINSCDGIVVCRGIFGLVKVKEILGDLGCEHLCRGNYPVSWGFAFISLCWFWLGLRRLLGLFPSSRPSSLCLFGWEIIGIDFYVVHQVVTEVHSGGIIGGGLHQAIYQESDMMGAGEDIDCGSKPPGLALDWMQPRLAIPLEDSSCDVDLFTSMVPF